MPYITIVNLLFANLERGGKMAGGQSVIDCVKQYVIKTILFLNCYNKKDVLVWFLTQLPNLYPKITICFHRYFVGTD